jgi:hypothetical protein
VLAEFEDAGAGNALGGEIDLAVVAHHQTGGDGVVRTAIVDAQLPAPRAVRVELGDFGFG